MGASSASVGRKHASVAIYKLLTYNKSDEDINKAFKAHHSEIFTCHAEMLSNTKSGQYFKTSHQLNPITFTKTELVGSPIS